MKISIIIPTRERAEYLYYSIQTALEIKDENLEILVCNNASQDNTEAVIKSFSDQRIIYVNTGARLSMRENFNRALIESSGDYVIFFGDDDGILPGQFKYLRQLLETHRPDGISWNRATYGWPVAGYGKKTGGIRFYRHSAYGIPYSYDPKTRNLDALMNCRLSYLTPVSPNIYHGCISKAYLDSLAPVKNIYFDSLIPDVNFEYRAILSGGNFLHADHAFSINGYSPASNGGAHKGFAENDPKAKPAQQFEQENKNDPYLDILENARFVPLAFFATLETVRARIGYTVRVPDLAKWYQYVLSQAQHKSNIKDKVNSTLLEYADKSGTLSHFEFAQKNQIVPKRTLGERLTRLKAQLSSFRVSAKKDGENTILSAVHVYDVILGDQYGSVLEASNTKRAAWKGARRRSKAFSRQL
jgi:glycosyltransferase involved in cell wall biosynthesis|tara:strand:+ start:559 stop:1803 length:1245 start_codon:yes stop_codon:yes gene_type:complete